MNDKARELMDQTPEYLTIEEAAALLRTNYRAVWKACRSGRIAAIQVGSLWRIPRESLQPQPGNGRKLAA